MNSSIVQSYGMMHGRCWAHSTNTLQQPITNTTAYGNNELAADAQNKRGAKCDLSTRISVKNTLERQNPNTDVSITNALQRLHVLLWELNSMERKAFLRTHDFLSELQNNVGNDLVTNMGNTAEKTEQVAYIQSTAMSDDVLPEVGFLHKQGSPRRPPSTIHSGNARVHPLDSRCDLAATL